MAERTHKRKKTTKGSTSQSYDTNLFRSLGCKKYYDSIPKTPKFVKERAICLAPGEFGDMQEQIRNRGWERFVVYPQSASRNLTLEFFANVCPKAEFDGSLVFEHNTSYVRGREIPFDAGTINELFGFPEVHFQDCGYRARLKRKPKLDVNCAAEIHAALCQPDTDWVRNGSGHPRKILTKSLTPAARGWAAFILHTICPCSNQTELNMERATLAASIVLGEPISLGHIIAREIEDFANVKLEQKPWWRHASLVTLLCEKAGVYAEPDEERIHPGAEITGGWIRNNSISIQEQEPDQPHQSQEHQEPQWEQAGFDGPSFDFEDLLSGPSKADFQNLEAKMDVLALDQRSLKDWQQGMAERQQRMEERQQRMEERQEKMADEQRTGMMALYRAMCSSQGGVQLDPDADIFQAPPQ